MVTNFLTKKDAKILELFIDKYQLKCKQNSNNSNLLSINLKNQLVEVFMSDLYLLYHEIHPNKPKRYWYEEKKVAERFNGDQNRYSPPFPRKH